MNFTPPRIRAKQISYCLIFIIFFPVLSLAQSGKNGAKTVGSSVMVNEYTTLSVDAAVGATSISVASSSLNSGGLFSGPLSTGDLVFIIQVQGATMLYPDDSTYGAISGYGNCGHYEFAEVASVPNASTINIICSLQNAYSTAGRTLVVRVPRYTTLTINSGGILTCPGWNGSTGGVLAVEVQGNCVINSGGRVDVSGKGFRGGALLDNNAWYGVLNTVWGTSDYGAEKGEGVVGYQTDYDALGGRYCKGAPANGGGGANAHNGGGGGGANAGNPATWTGRGNPDLSTAAWATAWNLEYSGFASSTSSGGGKGGYTFSGSNANALAVGPFNASWGGDQRRENGGRGGHPVDYTTGRIFLGGGGGSGDQNDSYGGPGGNGGGIAYLMVQGDISGSGQLLANGSAGTGSTSGGTDGAGGGGGGGVLMLNALGNITGVTASANGGAGGNQTVGVFTVEAEGPGGGGGGGYVAVSNGAIARTANGGNNGTTNSQGLTEFTPNGATKGGAGVNNAAISNFKITNPPVTICSGTSLLITLSTQGTIPSGTIFYWYDQPIGGSLLFTGTAYTTPVLYSNTTYYIATCPGFYRTPVQVNVNLVTASVSATTVCAGNPTIFTGSASTGTGTISSWNWNFGDGSGTAAVQNPSYTYSASGTYTVTLTATDNGGCSATATQSITVSPQPAVAFSASATSGCGSLLVNFSNTTSNASSYSWNFGDGSATSAQTAPSHTYSSAGTYTVTLTASNSSGCTGTSTATAMITVYPQPTASYSSNTNICLGDTIFFTNLSTGNGAALTGYSWNFGDASGLSSQTNPYHVFGTAGTFSVLLTSSTANCSDDTTQTITIAPSPVVNFSSSPSNGCEPLSVSFSNTTSGSPVYTWNFGDGSPASSLASPTHIYTSPGNYSVTLVATLGTCADTLAVPSMISVYPRPTAAYSCSSTSLCLGDTVYFYNSSNGNGATLTGYTWNFGDGSSTSSQVSPYHVFLSAGTYPVVLTANTANCTDDSIRTITVNPAPVAAFSTTTTNGCGALTVNFSNTTTGSPVYTWDFGDGSPTSSATAPVHTYTSTGTYTVTLIATQGSCADTVVRQNYINIYPQPVASFSSNNNVCLGDTIFFTNLSNGNGSTLTSYAWDFGDGSTISNLLNPSHLFTTPGSYLVHLTVSTANCTDDSTLTISVAPSPVVDFGASATGGCPGLSVNFTNFTTGSPTYFWDFGDGTAGSSLVNPSHVYSNAGLYSVTLIASQGSCADTLSKQSFILVWPLPTSSFTSPLSICLGDTLQLLDASVANGDPIISYQWDFGDGSPFSSAQNPRHQFSSSGTYNVTLTVSNGHCQDDTTLAVSVNPSPQVAFSSNAISGCGSLAVNFTNTTTGSPSYEWNFGDGSPASSLVAPSHTYSAVGVYTVTLIAVQGTCSDTLVVPSMITVSPQPIASFAAPNVCLGDTVHFSNLSTVTGATLTTTSWDFGDGSPLSVVLNPLHLYSSPGTYSVHLTTGTGTCSDDTVLNISVNPAPVVGFSASGLSGCTPFTVNFTNSTTGSPVYTWDFGDGTTSALATPSHTYSSVGVYTVSLIATQGTCADTLFVPNMISVEASPVAGFTSSSPCLGDSVHFTNTTLANGTTISGYSWDFGDGTTSSSLVSPTHYYSSAGSYTVTLVVSTTGSCPDTVQQNVIVLPKPSVSFTTSASSGCDSLTVQFSNTTTGASTYHWLFGDGDTSNVFSPSHTYTAPGTYNVTLTATTSGGCSLTRMYVNLIVIHATPTANFAASSTSICPGDCIGFTNLSSPGVTGWQWTFNGGTPSGSTISNPGNVCYANIGTYDVSLTVTNGYCASTKTTSGLVQVVNCSQLPTANFISSDTALCGGSCISFVSLSLNATSWQWSFPGATPSSSSQESPAGICYSTPGYYSVSLIVSNSSGTDTLQLNNFILVNANPPTPTFTQNGDTLTASLATTYQWYFNGIPISGANGRQFIATLSGTYTVLITDGKGCSSTATPRYIAVVGIEEAPNGGIIFLFPNPTDGIFNLLLQSSLSQACVVRVLDLLGREVFVKETHLSMGQQELVLDLSHNAAGLYFVQVDFSDSTILRKVVKQ